MNKNITQRIDIITSEWDIFLDYIKKERIISGLLFNYYVQRKGDNIIIQEKHAEDNSLRYKHIISINRHDTAVINNNVLFCLAAFRENLDPYEKYVKIYKLAKKKEV